MKVNPVEYNGNMKYEMNQTKVNLLKLRITNSKTLYNHLLEVAVHQGWNSTSYPSCITKQDDHLKALNKEMPFSAQTKIT